MELTFLLYDAARTLSIFKITRVGGLEDGAWDRTVVVKQVWGMMGEDGCDHGDSKSSVGPAEAVTDVQVRGWWLRSHRRGTERGRYT